MSLQGQDSLSYTSSTLLAGTLLFHSSAVVDLLQSTPVPEPRDLCGRLPPAPVVISRRDGTGRYQPVSPTSGSLRRPS